MSLFVVREVHMQINMLDAKNKLSSLVAAVERGDEVVLARDGVPVAKIVKYDRPKIKPPGAWKGLVPGSDEWNSPATNALVESLFYGEIEPRTPPAMHEPGASYRARLSPGKRKAKQATRPGDRRARR